MIFLVCSRVFDLLGFILHNKGKARHFLMRKHNDTIPQVKIFRENKMLQDAQSNYKNLQK